MNTIVICGFPGVGKTYAFNKLKDKYKILDSDSSNFSWSDFENKIRNPDFPNNYINHIKENIGKVDFIFVSTHKKVLNELDNNKIKYYIVCPDHNLQDFYKMVYCSRGNTGEFINGIIDNWDVFFKDMQTSLCKDIIYIDEHNTLIDVLNERFLNKEE